MVYCIINQFILAMKLKFLLLILFGLLSENVLSQDVFKTPIRIKANGKAIDLSSHTAPYIYDFNADGIADLLVGDFGTEPLEGLEDDPVYGRYVKGMCHIFINEGSNKDPVYKKGELLMAGDEPAYVPITCCVGFTPRFVDLNGDGVKDVISGSYPGEIYFFQGKKEGGFAKSEILKDAEGDTLHVDHSCVAEPIDYDADGDVDLLISTRMTGTYISINAGTTAKPDFVKGKLIELPKYEYVYAPLKEPRESHVSHAYPIDWNGDGLFDLVCGTEQGHLVWYMNSGSIGIPEFKSAVTLFTSNSGFNNIEGEEPLPIGSRCKVFPYDYDLDGKLDLLVGDFYSTTRTKRELTAVEEMEWDNARKRYSEILLELKEMFPVVKQFRQVAFFKKYDGLSKKLKRKVIKMDQEMEELNDITSKYQKLQEYLSHGYVWLFIRQ